LKLNPPVAIGSIVIVGALLIYGGIWPKAAGRFFERIQGWMLDTCRALHHLAGRRRAGGQGSIEAIEGDREDHNGQAARAPGRALAATRCAGDRGDARIPYTWNKSSDEREE
jgi:hypothetical protein